MCCMEIIIYFPLLQNSSRSIQANVVDHHAKLGKKISREKILDMVIIIFVYRSFEKSRADKTYTFFFLLPTRKTARGGKCENKKRKQARKL